MSALIPVPISPRPGVVVTESNRVAEGRWVLPFDKIRFVHGRPQKIGGNTRVTSTAMSGTPRATLCWQDFLQNGYVACGTYRKLYGFDSSFALNDITPFRATGTLGDDPFTSTAGSTSVTVNQSGHGVNSGDTVIFSGAFPAGTPSLYGGWSTSGNFWVDPATAANLAAYITAAGYTFTRALAATYYNSSGNLATASTGVQRIDYDPVALTVKGTLLEGAATNYLLQSNAFTTTWTGNATFSQNVTGPDGSANTGWTQTAAAGGANVQQTLSPGTSGTISLYVKAGTGAYVYIGVNDAGGGVATSFKTSNWTVGTQNWGLGGSPVIALSGAAVQQVGNGWYRISVNWSGAALTTIRFSIADADASSAFTTGKTLLMYGAQAEATTFQSSYIATTTGTVTRPADSLTRTRTSPTSLTKVVTAFTPPAHASVPVTTAWQLDDGSFNNFISIAQDAAGHIILRRIIGGVSPGALTLGTIAPNTKFTVALTCSAAGFAASLNGGAVVSDATAMPAGLVDEYLGSDNGGEQWFADVTTDAEWTGIVAANSDLIALSSAPLTGGSNLPAFLPYIGGAASMNGTFLCATVVDTNNYTVTTSTTARDSESYGGNAVVYSYEIAVGTELGAYGLGWGVGPWGLGTWGTPRSSSTIFNEPRVWSLDHFGTQLVATYNGGSIWFWDPTQNQPYGRALATFQGGSVTGAPTNFRAMFITPERFIFGLCDAMVVNVCSQGDPTTWTPATTNTAFARTLQIGSKLVGGKVLAPFISMVWSDSAAYLFQYTGSQFLYNSSVAGVDCGLISPNAAVTVDGFAYWMGPDNFYFYNGSVSPMPNVEDIRKYVFEAIPDQQVYQCNAVYVPKYHEIWFFYPTQGSTNPTNYVIFHINDQCWSVGTANFYSSAGVTAGRASGSHFTQGDTSPIMAGTDGYLYDHDPASLSYDDNGNALAWTLTLAPLAQNEGMQNVDVEGVVWDFFQQVGAISATLNMYDRLTDAVPIDTQTQSVPATGAGITDYRVHGRYGGVTLTQGVLGGYMRLGKPVIFVKPAGTRR